MALFDPHHFRLDLSNVARRLIYRIYGQYMRRVSKSLPVYDMEVVAIIRRLPADAVCIDVGVNEAQMFNVMVKHCRKGEVYGFEPIPQLYGYLQKRFSAQSVKLFPYALSDVEEEASFYHFPERTGLSGLSNRLPLSQKLATEKLSIRTAVFDKLLNLSRIDLVKIDVEGAELKVLRGAKQHIARCRPIVVFECQHTGLDYFDTDPEQIFNFFYELNYGVSLTKYFLQGLPPLEKDTLLSLVKDRYEYQFVAFPID